MQYGPADPYPTFTLGGTLAPPVDGQKGVIFNRSARIRSLYRAFHGEDPPPGWVPPPPEERPPSKMARKQMEEIDRKFWKYKKLRDEFSPRPEEYPGEYGNPPLDPFPIVFQPIADPTKGRTARSLRPPTQTELAEMKRIDAKYWHYKRLRDQWRPYPEEERPGAFWGPTLEGPAGQGLTEGYAGEPDVNHVGYGASGSTRTRRSSTGSAPAASGYGGLSQGVLPASAHGLPPAPRPPSRSGVVPPRPASTTGLPPNARPPSHSNIAPPRPASTTSTARPPSSATVRPVQRAPSRAGTQPPPPRPASAASGRPSAAAGPAPSFGSGARPPLGRRGSVGGGGGLPSSYSPRSELFSDAGRLSGPSDRGGIYGEWQRPVEDGYRPDFFGSSSRTPSDVGGLAGMFFDTAYPPLPGSSSGSATGRSSSTSRRR